MITFTASSRAKKHMKALVEQEHFFTKGIRRALFEIGFRGMRDSSDMINNDNRTGKIYDRNGSPHTSSAPGQAPSNMTGRLKKSYGYHVRNYDEVEVGTTLNYGRFLELGTRRIEARPVLYKVAANSQTTAIDSLMECVADEIKRRS